MTPAHTGYIGRRTVVSLPSGPRLHYDAATAASIGSPADGDRITTWNDISGNAAHVTRVNDHERPYYRATGFNGRPCVEFMYDSESGALKYDRLRSASAPARSFPASAILVYQLVSVSEPGDSGTESLITSTGNFQIGIWAGAVGSQGFGLKGGGVGKYMTVAVDLNDHSALFTTPAGGATTDLYLDATQHRNDVAIGSSDSPTDVALGARYGDTDYGLEIKIAEYIEWGREFTGVEVTQSFAYMSAKWGTP